MKNRSHRCEINKVYLCHIYVIYFSLDKDMDINILNTKFVSMTACIKLKLRNIWSSIHEKVKKHWGWVEKKALPIKKAFTFSKKNMASFTQNLVQNFMSLAHSFYKQVTMA